MISSVGGGRKEEPMEFLIPYLKERLRDRHAHTNTLDINPEQAVWCILCYNSHRLTYSTLVAAHCCRLPHRCRTPCGA
jgi:hypothetical protein